MLGIRTIETSIKFPPLPGRQVQWAKMGLDKTGQSRSGLTKAEHGVPNGDDQMFAPVTGFEGTICFI